MPSINYLLLKNQKPQRLFIYVRYRTSYFDTRIKTPIEIDRNKWDAKKQELKNPSRDSILARTNATLRELKTFLEEKSQLAVLDRILVTKEWFRNQVDDFFQNPTGKNQDSWKFFFLPLIDHYEQRTGKKVLRLKNLREELTTDVKITQINSEWLNKFIRSEQAKGTSGLYIGKKIYEIKLLLRFADEEGLRIDKKVLKVKAPKSKTKATYITEEELEKLFNLKLENESLDNVRKLFLIGCTTGLRISDLKRLHAFKIENNRLYIDRVQKTGEPLTIPLQQRIIPFISEVRPISDQKFNQYIKTVCELAGINEMAEGKVRIAKNKNKTGIFPKYEIVSSHTMRRTFASNLFGKLPAALIKELTGHATEKMLNTYVKRGADFASNELERYYKDNNL